MSQFEYLEEEELIVSEAPVTSAIPLSLTQVLSLHSATADTELTAWLSTSNLFDPSIQAQLLAAAAQHPAVFSCPDPFTSLITVLRSRVPEPATIAAHAISIALNANAEWPVLLEQVMKLIGFSAPPSIHIGKNASFENRSHRFSTHTHTKKKKK